MKTHKIKLGKGKNADYALVDYKDRQRVEEFGPWFKHKTGYAFRNITVNKKRRTVYLHRFVVGLEYGDERLADHIDGDKLNNTSDNLRIISAGENCQNITVSRGNTSRYRGVSKCKDTWVGSVNIPNEGRVRRFFTNEDDAALWCQEMRDKHMPFANPDPAVVELKEMINAYQELVDEMSDEYPIEYDYNEYYDFPVGEHDNY